MRVLLGILTSLALFVASLLFIAGGYQVEVTIYQDGERAIAGLLHGGLLFVLLSSVFALGFRTTYRARIGSWAWFLLGAYSAPIALIVFLFSPV